MGGGVSVGRSVLHRRKNNFAKEKIVAMEGNDVVPDIDGEFFGKIAAAAKEEKMLTLELVNVLLQNIQVSRFATLSQDSRYGLLESMQQFVCTGVDGPLRFLLSFDTYGYSAATTLPCAAFFESPCTFSTRTKLTSSEGKVYFQFLGQIYGRGITALALTSLLRSIHTLSELGKDAALCLRTATHNDCKDSLEPMSKNSYFCLSGEGAGMMFIGT